MTPSPLVLGRFTLVQTLYQIGTVMMMSVGILAATPLAPSAFWGALPLALSVAGNFSGLFPASAFMKRWGRKRGLFVGMVLATVGVSGIVAGLFAGSFALVCGGFLVYGLHQSFLGYLRFMAMESAGPAHGPAALSWILVGGIPAAFLGPLVGLWGRNLGPGPDYSGCFLLLLGVLAAQVLIVATLPAGGSSVAEKTVGPAPRPWKERLADPSLWLAIAAAAFSYGLMVMLMAASPVAMHEHGHPMSDAAMVLQAHVLGMYIPSFFTGWMVKRWGPRKMILGGIGLFVLELVQALQGTDFLPFFVALILLGVGWNFLYVGGTNLLVSRYRPSEKTGVQAFNDTFVYVFATVSTFGAGALERTVGWFWLNCLSVPFLVALVVLVFVSRNQGRTFPAAK